MGEETPFNQSKSASAKVSVGLGLDSNYHSTLIDQIKACGLTYRIDGIEIQLAREFGFCYGVDRAVRLAYDTRARFPQKTIYLVSEIIHNQFVNSKLRAMGIKFLSDWKISPEFININMITPEDIVLIPAFGISVPVLEKLKARGCVLVDTTCGSVMAVWKRVEEYAKDGFTALIHGKFNHEETRATCSRVSKYPGGKYLVVDSIEQSAKVRDFILGKGSRPEFLAEFSSSASSGFDPEKDLAKIGCANQTTMLSEESLAIAGMIQEAMVKRYGQKDLKDHFRHFETICRATQDRQNAVLELARSGVDLILVVGGYNSSNTAHLCEIASKGCPVYHVQDAGEIISRNEIRHKLPSSKEAVITSNWVPAGLKRIGITGGASTPDRVIEEVINRLESLLK